MSDGAETQDVADARQSKDIALTLALRLAGRLMAHVDEHPELAHGIMRETHALPGNVEWHLSVKYGAGHLFVGVEGHPQWTGPAHVSEVEYAQIMQNTAQEFTCNVPRPWVLAALRESERVE